MKDHSRAHRYPLYAVLCVLLLATGIATGMATGTVAQNGVANPGVLKRMTTMTTAKTAIDTLANMMAGRFQFNRSQARAARRDLISATRSIPSVFRKPHSDPQSRARTEIWWQWDDFETRAKTAKKAAQALRVSRLETLRSTLPGLIHACLDCHRTYRQDKWGSERLR
ncbi:MAG: cytochrome c556 [Paracoccaceae bacterium]|jgi:cytochrome c556